MLNVQRLKVLREVVAQGSFSEAASALNYTQSAVSQAIATLESEAGVPLIERDRRGVRPTSAGDLLAEHAGRILVEGEPEELIPRLRDGEFDLGLIFESEGTGALGPGLRSTPLFDDPMKLALPKGHRLARPERVAPDGAPSHQRVTLEDLAED